MKNAYWFSFSLMAGMAIHYFILYWWFPFLWCLMAAIIFSDSIKNKAIISFGIFSACTATVLYITRLTGSDELIQMTGEIFKGLSFVQLSLASSFIMGTTASLGAALGTFLNFRK